LIQSIKRGIPMFLRSDIFQARKKKEEFPLCLTSILTSPR
jgi:hypothetical protein